MANDIVLGVVADTHVPDRVAGLPEKLLQALDAQSVEYILHAGDISRQRIIDHLSEIAPVYAVQGNRDWFYGLKLPTHIDLTFNGVKLTLTHGHGNIPHYIYDKIQYLLMGYTLTRYQRNLAKQHPAAQIQVQLTLANLMIPIPNMASCAFHNKVRSQGSCCPAIKPLSL